MGDGRAAPRSAGARSRKGSPRQRAVGTRDRVIAHLTAVTEITDETGMASTRLAEAVGYPGSSVAFAQLLSGMERDGLIVREVRGKRTYRISLPPSVAATAAQAAPGENGRVPEHGDFDYDELARRLLIQVVRRLAANPGEAVQAAEPEQAALEQTVAGLEQELASAWSKHGSLTAENVKLREQLREAKRNLELARERARRMPITGQLNHAEVVLLERLISPAEPGAGQQDASAG